MKHDTFGSGSPWRALWLAAGLPQHPYEHRPERPILLAVGLEARRRMTRPPLRSALRKRGRRYSSPLTTSGDINERSHTTGCSCLGVA